MGSHLCCAVCGVIHVTYVSVHCRRRPPTPQQSGCEMCPFLTDPPDDALIRAGPLHTETVRSHQRLCFCVNYALEARRDLTKPLHLLICLISTPSIRWGRGANYWHQMLWCLVSRQAVERQSSGLLMGSGVSLCLFLKTVAQTEWLHARVSKTK